MISWYHYVPEQQPSGQIHKGRRQAAFSDINGPRVLSKDPGAGLFRNDLLYVDSELTSACGTYP